MKYHVDFDLSFLPNTYGGKFVVLEGIDGSGKSTQMPIIQKKLEDMGQQVLLTHEPTREGHIGKLIHDVLQAEVQIPPVGLQYLFAADRSVHQEQVIKPSLQKQMTVLSERCFWSAVPYGLADKNTVDYARVGEALLVMYSLLSMYNQFIRPDVTFFLDIPVDVALFRLSQMDKHKEIYERKEKLEKIYAGYHFLIDKFPEEFVVVDGTKSQDEITKEITNHVASSK